MVNNVSQEDWTRRLADAGDRRADVAARSTCTRRIREAAGCDREPGDADAARAGRQRDVGRRPTADHDGIPDAMDYCPTSPEDKDGVDDDDGCPDPDNDGDRIPDRDDKCPNEPETYNGYEDNDGCPDRGRVVVTDTSIEILDQHLLREGQRRDASRARSRSSTPSPRRSPATPTSRRSRSSGHASDRRAAMCGASRRTARTRCATPRGTGSRRRASSSRRYGAPSR